MTERPCPKISTKFTRYSGRHIGQTQISKRRIKCSDSMLNAIRIHIPMFFFHLFIYIAWIRKYFDREDTGFRDFDVFTHSEPLQPQIRKKIFLDYLPSICLYAWTWRSAASERLDRFYSYLSVVNLAPKIVTFQMNPQNIWQCSWQMFQFILFNFDDLWRLFPEIKLHNWCR
jgi:hypothetical protein